MITSAYSKSSNSSRFNPILQKFYRMICEITISKTVCGIFLIICRSSFINNFIVNNNFSEPSQQTFVGLQHVFSVTIFRLLRHLEEVLKTSWRMKYCYAEDVLKTCLEDILKTCLENIFITPWRLKIGNICISQI